MKETEFGGLADDQAELTAMQLERSSFLHAKGRDGEAFQGRGHAGNSGHGAFDAHVIGPRDAAANAHALAGARQAVVSRATRDSVHQIFANQRRRGLEAFLAKPAVEDFENPAGAPDRRATLRR